MSDPLIDKDPAPGAASPPEARRDDRPSRGWTIHGLNSGAIFSATCRGVSFLPRSISYGIGHAGTWLAWRLMAETREAVADNLRALFPDATDRELERRALVTLRSYANDVIDFIRALEARDDEARQLFVRRPEDDRLFLDVLGEGRGIILVSGHYGNWEIGSVLMRRVFQIPMTVMAMAEASEDANRMRREIRDSLGVGTIEVRKSFDTALQIRRWLSDNGVVAMLMDRYVGKDRVEVSLLGRRAWFLRTPALMGYLTGAPLVPCFVERLGPARFRVRPEPPIHVPRDRPREEAIRATAQEFADRLEARIREYPHYWYQFYPYWRTQEQDGT